MSIANDFIWSHRSWPRECTFLKSNTKFPPQTNFDLDPHLKIHSFIFDSDHSYNLLIVERWLILHLKDYHWKWTSHRMKNFPNHGRAEQKAEGIEKRDVHAASWIYSKEVHIQKTHIIYSNPCHLLDVEGLQITCIISNTHPWKILLETTFRHFILSCVFPLWPPII